MAPAARPLRLQLCPGALSLAVVLCSISLLNCILSTHWRSGGDDGVRKVVVMMSNMGSDAAREDTVFVQPPALEYIRRLAVAGETCRIAVAHCIAVPSERCGGHNNLPPACTVCRPALISCVRVPHDALRTHAAPELVCSMLRPSPGTARDANHFQVPAAHWADAPEPRRILLRNSADVGIPHWSRCVH